MIVEKRPETLNVSVIAAALPASFALSAFMILNHLVEFAHVKSKGALLVVIRSLRDESCQNPVKVMILSL